MRYCPKCGEADERPNGEICPACGIVYEKFLAAERRQASIRETDGEPSALLVAEAVVPKGDFYARAAGLVLFTLWTFWFIGTDHRQVMDGLPEINHSIMHSINLAFHEAGHVFFGIFGRFIGVLGGTLGQLIMPAVVVVAFLLRQRNLFGASIGVWWFGQSLMDCAPYIHDAQRQIVLLVGGGIGAHRPGFHDWNNILRDLDLLEYNEGIATFVDFMGAAVMLGALLWAGAILYHQWQRLDRRF